MQAARLFRKLAVVGLVTGALVLVYPVVDGAGDSVAYARSAENGVEVEQVLFVQTLPLKNGKVAYDLSWIPAPLEKYCLGKSHQACATMDFCLRTTTPSVAMCRNLGAALTRMPRYPRDMSPRRMLTITLFPPSTMPGFDLLQNVAQTLPRSSAQAFSMAGRVKARVRLTQKPDDDDLTILEILSVAPF